MAENLDPNTMYLEWSGSSFPNSSSATFKAPAGSTIDWGDGTVETFDTDSTQVNTHTYNDGVDNHLIRISGVTRISDSAFQNCSSLTSVVIPDSVTLIGWVAFYYCSGLTSVTIPDSVTSIGNEAFKGCDSLTFNEYGNCQYLGNEENPYHALIQAKTKNYSAYTIHENTKVIANTAFFYCTRMSSIVIPSSVTSIGREAFKECDSLTSIMAFSATPPKLNYLSLPSTIQSIYVQMSSAEAYKRASIWSSFADKIVGNTTYLSFVRFNQANKKYIDSKISALESRIAELESKLNG